MQKYTIILLIIISNLTFGQNTKDRTDSNIKKFRKEMKKKDINEFFIINHKQYFHIGGVNKIYAFWKEKNDYWLKAYDNVGGFVAIKLNNGKAWDFYHQNFDEIKVEEVERYKLKPDSIAKGKIYSFRSSQSHSALRYYWFYKDSVKFKKFIDEYDLTTKERSPNISYGVNQNLALVKLNSICDEIIKESEKVESLKREE